MSSRMVQNMSDEEYFSNLNNILEEFVTGESTNEYFSLLDAMEQIALIIIKHNELINSNNYTFNEYISIDDSTLLVDSFLNSINPSYQNHFRNMSKSKDESSNGSSTINFIPLIYFNNSYGGVNASGTADIYYHNGINDAFILTHELFHLFQGTSMIPGKSPSDYLSETISITSEFLLQDYLNSLKLNNNEINNYVKVRLSKEHVGALRFVYEKKLVDLYLRKKSENKKITSFEQISDELGVDKDFYVNQMLKKFNEEFADSIIMRKKVAIPSLQRYIIGLTIACNLHDKILNNPEEISTFINLINDIGDKNSELLQVLQKYGLDFFSMSPSNEIIINNEVINKFDNSFDNELSRLNIESTDKVSL